MRSTIVSALEGWPEVLGGWPKRRASEVVGIACLAFVGASSLALMSWSVDDPSLNHATVAAVHNWLGRGGAIFADLAMQGLGLASLSFVIVPSLWGWRLLSKRPIGRPLFRALTTGVGVAALAAAVGFAPVTGGWPLLSGLGGLIGDAVDYLPRLLMSGHPVPLAVTGFGFLGIAILSLTAACGYGLTGVEEAFVARPEPKKGAK